MNKNISNKTRRLGWGYTCWTKPGDAPTKPDHTGTVTQILDAINHDRDFQIMRSDGTYLATSWFFSGHPIKLVNGYKYTEDQDHCIGNMIRGGTVEIEY